MKSFLFELTPETGVCRAPRLGRMPAENLGAAVAAAIGLMAPDGRRTRTVSIIGEEAPAPAKQAPVEAPVRKAAGEPKRTVKVRKASAPARQKARLAKASRQRRRT